MQWEMVSCQTANTYWHCQKIHIPKHKDAAATLRVGKEISNAFDYSIVPKKIFLQGCHLK
jgi:hypothetical protein